MITKNLTINININSRNSELDKIMKEGIPKVIKVVEEIINSEMPEVPYPREVYKDVPECISKQAVLDWADGYLFKRFSIIEDSGKDVDVTMLVFVDCEKVDFEKSLDGLEAGKWFVFIKGESGDDFEHCLYHKVEESE